MIASRAIFRGTFRLSVVIALLTGAYITYRDLVANDRVYWSNWELVHTLECGARNVEKMSAEALKLITNEVGLINLGKAGCADRQFLASVHELDEARNGTMRETWMQKPKFDIADPLIGALMALVAVNLLGFAFVGTRAVFSWVARGFKPNA